MEMVDKVKKKLNGNSHLIGWITLMLTLLGMLYAGGRWTGTIEQQIRDESAQLNAQSTQINRLEQKIDSHLLQSAR